MCKWATPHKSAHKTNSVQTLTRSSRVVLAYRVTGSWSLSGNYLIQYTVHYIHASSTETSDDKKSKAFTSK